MLILFELWVDEDEHGDGYDFGTDGHDDDDDDADDSNDVFSVIFSVFNNQIEQSQQFHTMFLGV